MSIQNSISIPRASISALKTNAAEKSPDKLVHNKDLKNIAREIKQLHNAVKENLLIASQRNKVGDRSTYHKNLGEKISKVSTKIKNKIDDINNKSSYKHNPNKIKTLDRLLHEANKEFKNAKEADKAYEHNQNQAKATQESKTRSHNQKQDRANYKGEHNGGMIK